MALEFFTGVVVFSRLEKSGERVLGYGFILADGVAPDTQDAWIWFGARTTNDTMLAKGERVKFALASNPTKHEKMAASVVRPESEGMLK